MSNLFSKRVYLVIVVMLLLAIGSSTFVFESRATFVSHSQKNATAVLNDNNIGSSKYKYIYNSSSIILITTNFGAHFEDNVSILAIKIEHLENTAYQHPNDDIYFQELTVLTNANQSIEHYDLNNYHNYRAEVLLDLPRAYEMLSINISLKLSEAEGFFQIQTPMLTSEAMDDDLPAGDTFGKQLADFLNQYQPLALLSIVIIGFLWVVSKIRYWGEEDTFSLREVRSMADPSLKRRVDLFLVMTALSIGITIYSIVAFMFDFTLEDISVYLLGITAIIYFITILSSMFSLADVYGDTFQIIFGVMWVVLSLVIILVLFIFPYTADLLEFILIAALITVLIVPLSSIFFIAFVSTNLWLGRREAGLIDDYNETFDFIPTLFRLPMVGVVVVFLLASSIFNLIQYGYLINLDGFFLYIGQHQLAELLVFNEHDILVSKLVHSLGEIFLLAYVSFSEIGNIMGDEYDDLSYPGGRSKLVMELGILFMCIDIMFGLPILLSPISSTKIFLSSDIAYSLSSNFIIELSTAVDEFLFLNAINNVVMGIGVLIGTSLVIVNQWKNRT